MSNQSKNKLRIVNWNARSLLNKKSQLETLIYKFQPQVLCITETWLKPEHSFSVFNYNIFRGDRLHGRGGGVAVLVHRDVLTLSLDLHIPDPDDLFGVDFLGIRVRTVTGFVEIVAVYSSPDFEPESQSWQAILQVASPRNVRVVCGDFNAHSPSWGAMKSNCRGNRLVTAMEECGMIPINDSLPTYIPAPESRGSNLDLVFVALKDFPICSFQIAQDSFSSDHLPILLDIAIGISHSEANTYRLNTTKVNWTRFGTEIDRILEIGNGEKEETAPNVSYDTLLGKVVGTLLDCGACLPVPSKGGRKSQPLWWNDECDALIEGRRESLRNYLCSQTEENLINYRRISNSVKRSIRKIKAKSFKDFCDSLSLDKGMTNIWKRVKAMIGRSGSGLSSSHTDPDGLEMKEMQDSLVREDIPPSTYIPEVRDDGMHPMNRPFRDGEFRVALDSSNVRSAPGLDSISYEIFKRFPSSLKEAFLSTFNEMFHAGTYPDSWRDTLVRFIPKGTGGYRPISLTSCLAKIMERMVSARLEVLAETEHWLPDFQFGFRRGRSSLDAVALLVTEVYGAFSRGESLVALALDIKGAFNSIRPNKIIQELIQLDTPSRLINFVSFMISQRNLHFAGSRNEPRTSGVGVPQGGVLSPFLFSLALRRIADHLPRGIGIIMYADDIIIYSRGVDVDLSVTSLQQSFDTLRNWLEQLGLDISLPKTQYTIFSRKRTVLQAKPSIVLGELELKPLDGIKYLGIVLDQKLYWHPHISSLVIKAKRALNVLRVLSGVSWGPSPSSLLLVTVSLIGGYLRWGAPFFLRAGKVHLLALDRVFYSAIRVSLGAMRTTPLAILLSEAGLSHPDLMRAECAHQFILRNAQWKDNPFMRSIGSLMDEFKRPNKKLNISKCGLLEAFVSTGGLRDLIRKSSRPSYLDLSWDQIMWEGEVDVELGQNLKESEFPQLDLNDHLDSTQLAISPIYTDASFNGLTQNGGIAYYVPGSNYRFAIRISEFFSVSSMELLAVLYAIRHGIAFRLPNVIVLSDSKRSVEIMRGSILGKRKLSVLAQETIVAAQQYNSLGIGTIRFLWSPAHCGITGNEIADSLAKSATRLPIQRHLFVGYEDLKEVIRRDLGHWRDVCWPFFPIWNSTNLYYRFINVKTPRPWFSGVQSDRKTITLINRIRTGHISTTDHLSRFVVDADVVCDCGYLEKSLRHLLLVCPLFRKRRAQFLQFLSEVDSTTTDPAINLRIASLRPSPKVISQIKIFFSQSDVNI